MRAIFGNPGTVVSVGIGFAVGLLTLAGCVSDRGKSSGAIPDGPSPQSRKEVAASPPAVLFVAFVGTPQDVVERMLKMAHVGEDDVVCDLGCGDGRIVVTAAKRYGCRALGYDLDHLRVEEARENARRNGVEHLVTIEQKDVLMVDLQEATVVTIYMGTEMNARLIPQLRRLKAGSRIVSHQFGLGNIPPDKTAEMTSREDNSRHKIHLWRCPLPIATRK